MGCYCCYGQKKNSGIGVGEEDLACLFLEVVVTAGVKKAGVVAGVVAVIAGFFADGFFGFLPPIFAVFGSFITSISCVVCGYAFTCVIVITIGICVVLCI